MENPTMLSCKAAVLSFHSNKSVKDWKSLIAIPKGCQFFQVIQAMCIRLYGTLAGVYQFQRKDNYHDYKCIRGEDKHAYLWNFCGDSLNNMTVVDALPHCKDSLNLQGKVILYFKAFRHRDQRFIIALELNRR